MSGSDQRWNDHAAPLRPKAICRPAGRLAARAPARSRLNAPHRPLIALALVLASAAVYFAFANANSHPILLPVEVLGDDGTVVSNTVTLPAAGADSVQSLWLRTNGLHYPTQGSVQLNDSPWIPLQNENVTIDEPGRSYGGIGGGFATLSMKIALPKGAAVAGTNTIRFRFNHTDGVSSGYRVLAWNFLTSDGTKILPPEEFSEDNPEAWSPPLNDSTSIEAGRKLWQTASLTQNGQPNSPRIQAHCADCHAQDGRDLKYFNYSNHSIVTRSRFHGLSATEGQQIASYVRSLPLPHPGRPWNPPYQPGPGLDRLPVADWASGAGIDWVLDQDVAALPYLVNQREGSPAASTAASGPQQLAREITPELFRPDGDLSPRQIPVSLQLPDWNEWLPRVHPKDAWGPAFSQSEFGKFYDDATDSRGTRDPGTRTTLQTLLQAATASPANLRNVPAAFDQWSRARRLFLKPSMKPGTAWTPALTDKVYSTQLWQLTKTWELTQHFGLEGRARDLYGPSADARSWFNTVPADTAPSAGHIPDGPAGVGGSALSNAYFNAAWYELQILLNSGNHQHRDRGPVDWVYVVGWFHDLYYLTHHPEPVRLLVAIIKSQQSSDPHLGPGDPRRGWQPDRNIDPRILISPAWQPLFQPLPRDVHAALTSAFLAAWVDKNQQYSIANYLPVGIRTETYSYTTYGDITGGEVWTSAPQFENAGVSEDLVDRLLRWGSTYTDRAARLQYEGRTHAEKPQNR